jgi:hypothetical protein
MGLAGGRTVVGLPSAGRGARGRLGGRYSRPPGLSGGQKAFRPLEAASASYPPFPKKPSPPGSLGYSGVRGEGSTPVPLPPPPCSRLPALRGVLLAI